MQNMSAEHVSQTPRFARPACNRDCLNANIFTALNTFGSNLRRTTCYASVLGTPTVA